MKFRYLRKYSNARHIVRSNNMFFALITFELGALGTIKVTKTVKGAKKTEEMGERGGDCGGGTP